MDHLNKESSEERTELLAVLKKDNSGYDVPKDYFSKLQANVLSQVIDEPEALPKSFFDRMFDTIQLLRQPKFAMVAAACVLVVITIGIRNSTTTIKPADVWSSLTVDDYEYYFDSSIEEYNNLDLMAVLSEDELIDQNTITPISTIEIPDLVADEYIDGLDEDVLLEFHSIDE